MPSPLPTQVVREMWDFADVEASARRFAAAADDVTRPIEHRAELRTQHARALGLLGHLDAAHEALDSVVVVTDPGDVARVRVLVERGRLHRAAGDLRAAMPVLREAVRSAERAGATELAVDALHMLALVHPAGAESWTDRALALVGATADPELRRWAVPLHTNLGWILHDDGRVAEALAHLEDAHRAALDMLHAPSAQPGVPDPQAVEQEQVSRWGIARCLRSLGRTSEALAMQRRLLVERPDDPYVRAEVGALGEAPGARVSVEGDPTTEGAVDVEALASLAGLAGVGWGEPAAQVRVDAGAAEDETGHDDLVGRTRADRRRGAHVRSDTDADDGAPDGDRE